MGAVGCVGSVLSWFGLTPLSGADFSSTPLQVVGDLCDGPLAGVIGHCPTAGISVTTRLRGPTDSALEEAHALKGNR